MGESRVNMGDYFRFVPNYTGPYISNGRFQSSVKFGDRKPKDRLDSLSRLHDTAYANWSDSKWHRMAADSIYADEAFKIGGVIPRTAGTAVRYGNAVIDGATHMTKRAAQGLVFGSPLLGLVQGGVENLAAYSGYRKNEKALKNEVLSYYATDPHAHLQI